MPRTVPVSATQVAGNLITGALWNAGPAASNSFLTAVPVASIFQGSITTSLAANSWTSVGMDSTSEDTDSQHSNSVNNSRFVCQVAGLYLPLGCVSFASNSASSRGARIAKNGNAFQSTQQLLPPSGAYPTTVDSVPSVIQMAVGDYLEIQGFPGISGLSTQIGTDGSTSQLTVFWLRT